MRFRGQQHCTWRVSQRMGLRGAPGPHGPPTCGRSCRAGAEERGATQPASNGPGDASGCRARHGPGHSKCPRIGDHGPHTCSLKLLSHLMKEASPCCHASEHAASDCHVGQRSVIASSGPRRQLVLLWCHPTSWKVREQTGSRQRRMAAARLSTGARAKWPAHLCTCLRALSRPPHRTPWPAQAQAA